MTLVRSFILTLLLLLLASAVSGCSDTGNALPDSPEAELHLRLHVAQAMGQSRADYTFDPSTASEAEALRSLRVVMVRAYDDMIVHNRYISLAEAGKTDAADLSFKVDFATAYRIYLIANEAGIPDGAFILQTYKLAEGQSYPPGYLEDVVIRSEAPGYPLVECLTADELTPVPMTEVFEVETIAAPDDDSSPAAAFQDENLFITRAASKFAFYFFRANDVPADFDLSIHSIKISGLGSEEYLLPRADYEPAKYPLSTDDRVITDFVLPPTDEAAGDALFALPEPLAVSSLTTKPATGDITLGAVSYLPAAYFTESKGLEGGSFECSISFDGVTYETPVTLPNLPALPRNTFVRVAITVKAAGGWEMTASIVPYTPDVLKPVFGL